MTKTKGFQGCIALVSMKHGDTYAYPIARSVDRTSDESLLAFAIDFASTLALDDGERLAVYLSDKQDPGAARLTGPSETYIGEIQDGEVYDPRKWSMRP